jgi:hypothetical protein
LFRRRIANAEESEMDHGHSRLLLICLLGAVTTAAAPVEPSELDEFARSSSHRDLNNFCWNTHTPEANRFQTDRYLDERYRTSPLKGLWTYSKGGYFHNGRFATLGEVFNHYDQLFELRLPSAEKADLIEYLKSLRQQRELTRSTRRRST